MKPMYVIVFFTLIRMTMFAQGIQFEEGLNWSQVKAKAKAENKYIFMDCYATWCGPCKWMTQNIFPQKAVGDYFNKHFISVAVQLDQTPSDPPNIKSWYSDAKQIMSQYSVTVMPTYLFFTPDGEALHRITGSTGNDPQTFIEKASEAFIPEKQYYSTVAAFEIHRGDSAYLRNALEKTLQAGDKENASKILPIYLNAIENPFDHKTIFLARQTMSASNDSAFQFFANNKQRIDSVVQPGFAQSTLCFVVLNEELDPLLSDFSALIDYPAITSKISAKYPDLVPLLANQIADRIKGYVRSRLRSAPAGQNVKNSWESEVQQISKRYHGINLDQPIAMAKMEYFNKHQQWNDCELAAYDCYVKYGNTLSSREINNIAWDHIFMRGSNSKTRKEAVKWMKKVVEKEPDAGYIDTYANLLYKSGIVKAALQWEQKAVEMLLTKENKHSYQTSDLKEFQETFEKMKKGEKTWLHP